MPISKYLIIQIIDTTIDDRHFRDQKLRNAVRAIAYPRNKGIYIILLYSDITDMSKAGGYAVRHANWL